MVQREVVGVKQHLCNHFEKQGAILRFSKDIYTYKVGPFKFLEARHRMIVQ
jgi:hypothetical protein